MISNINNKSKIVLNLWILAQILLNSTQLLRPRLFQGFNRKYPQSFSYLNMYCYKFNFASTFCCESKPLRPWSVSKFKINPMTAWSTWPKQRCYSVLESSPTYHTSNQLFYRLNCNLFESSESPEYNTRKTSLFNFRLV